MTRLGKQKNLTSQLPGKRLFLLRRKARVTGKIRKVRFYLAE